MKLEIHLTSFAAEECAAFSKEEEEGEKGKKKKKDFVFY